MSEDKSSYRQIMKATSIFGGVQVFNIIISIVRSKFIAVLLGPEGMGIANLLTSTTNLVGSIFNLGLSTSAVKNVAAANSTGDLSKVDLVISVLKRLVFFAGLAGACFTLAFAPVLSKITFGNHNYTLAFIWISFTVLLAQLNAGQLVILQGMRKLQYLAKANVAGSAFALLISVPIYYMLGLKGIVPAIIISAFITLLSSWYFGSKVKIGKIRLDKASLFSEGGDMIRMGFFLSLNSFVTMGTSYIMRIYISNTGGVEQVGLYNAGFALINTNIGMVFSAMATDYFPRLSGVTHDMKLTRDTINQQAEIALLILAPILSVFIIFVNWFVLLFYSSRFSTIENMIHWAALGIFFQATSWCIAYLLVAKGDTRLFFINEVSANTYMLGINILGYMWKGLEGLGISFFAGYLLYAIQVSLLAGKKYGFSYDREFYKIFGVQFFLAILCFIISRIMGSPWQFIAGSVLILLSCYYSFRELNKRLNFVSLILDKFKKTNSGK